MKKSIAIFITCFGQLLNIYPQPATSAQQRLQRTRAAMSSRTDESMIRRDVEMVGRDMQKIFSREIHE